MTGPGSVVYVIPDKLGGSLTIVRALLNARPVGALRSQLLLTDNTADLDSVEARTRRDCPHDARTGRRRKAEATTGREVAETVVRYTLPSENLYAVLQRLRSALPPGPGVLVSNDWLELAMEHAYPSGRAVVQLLHGDHPYYYDLAARHEAVIDVFIAYSRAMEAGLRARLPHRGKDIVFLPYGVALPAASRMAAPGPLRLVFAGRLEHEQKGVLDLPRIDRQLAGRGVPVAWTIIGAGPHERELRAQWGTRRPVTWLGALSHQATLDQLPQCDVFVLPTRAEGLPVALIEAMGAGLVPVVSDIPSGVPEVVEREVSGLLMPVGDVAAFAAAIEALATDRPRLERMSAAARASARARGDAAERARDYYALFDTLAARPRLPRAATTVPYGSRLDRAWIPNAVVRGVRALRGRG